GWVAHRQSYEQGDAEQQNAHRSEQHAAAAHPPGGDQQHDLRAQAQVEKKDCKQPENRFQNGSNHRTILHTPASSKAWESTAGHGKYPAPGPNGQATARDGATLARAFALRLADAPVPKEFPSEGRSAAQPPSSRGFSTPG